MKDSNQNKQDCELFLRAFEKPTQIYRYLRMRRLLSPLFLQRNLSYLNGRSTKRRTITKRQKKKPFNWDAFLQGLKPVKNNELSHNFLTIKFLGYFDQHVTDDSTNAATIDIFLQSQSSNQSKSLLKSIPVEINPSTMTNATPITLSKDQLTCYTSKNDQNDRSCMLLIEVSYAEHPNGNNSDNVRSQRSRKRKKVSHNAKLPIFDKHGRCVLVDAEYELNLDESTEMTTTRLTWATNIPKVLAGDKRYFENRSLKFSVQWRSNSSSNTSNTSSSSSSSSSSSNDGGIKSKSTSPTHHHHENGAPAATTDTADWGDVRIGSTTSLSTSSSGILSDMSSDDAEITAITTNKKLPNTLPSVLSNHRHHSSPFVDLLVTTMGSHLIYRFIYNDDLSQKTVTWDEFLCPWCDLNCRSLHPLLMHLRLCHDRFKFSYTPKDDGIQVDVSINSKYNCALSPLKTQRSDSQLERPYKRKPYTKVLVSRQRAKKQKSCSTFEELDEAIASDIDSSDAEEDKFTVGKCELHFDGHGRQYSRTTNNMMYTHQADFDEDSEGEMDPEWLRVHTKNLLEEFTDVNEGEKEMLKMWNLHVMKHNFVGYTQMALASEMFVNEHGDEILAKNLYRNFVLHLTNLHDYDMLTSGQMFTIVQKLQLKRENEVEILVTTTTTPT